MTLLLDTHAFLWFWWADPLLSATASAVIRDPANRKLVSPASSWEVAIKVSRKKLDMGAALKDTLQRDFYAEMCRMERWSVRTLRAKIGGMLFERTALSKNRSYWSSRNWRSSGTGIRSPRTSCFAIPTPWIFWPEGHVQLERPRIGDPPGDGAIHLLWRIFRRGNSSSASSTKR
jgi:hypothetical protein